MQPAAVLPLHQHDANLHMHMLHQNTEAEFPHPCADMFPAQGPSELLQQAMAPLLLVSVPFEFEAAQPILGSACLPKAVHPPVVAEQAERFLQTDFQRYPVCSEQPLSQPPVLLSTQISAAEKAFFRPQLSDGRNANPCVQFDFAYRNPKQPTAQMQACAKAS